jgi:hypothetical protein
MHADCYLTLTCRLQYYKQQPVFTLSLGLITPLSPLSVGHSEPAPTSAPSRMNGKRSGNSFLLAFSSLANHGG